MKTTLIQKKYYGDGIYVYNCSECKTNLFLTEKLTDVYIESTGELKEGFRVKFCYFCGKKFTDFVILD